MAFVMVLSYDVQDALMPQARGCAGAASRHLFLRFYPNGAMNNFLRNHVEGFNFFGAFGGTQKNAATP